MTGRELRAIRVELGLTQSGLAVVLGLRAGTISDLERGKMKISLSVEKHLLTVHALHQIGLIIKKVL